VRAEVGDFGGEGFASEGTLDTGSVNGLRFDGLVDAIEDARDGDDEL
jgi:hypothetical protein